MASNQITRLNALDSDQTKTGDEVGDAIGANFKSMDWRRRKITLTATAPFKTINI